MKFWVTFFDDFYATSCVGKELDLEELAELIRNTSAPDKKHLPLLKLAKFGSVRTQANSLRHDQNVLNISGIEIDYDGEQMPFQEVVDRLDTTGVAYLAHTTSRSTPTGPRWRVLLPTSKLLPPGERSELVDRLNGLLGGVLGLESWSLSQAYLYGHVNGALFELVVNDVEECVDEATELAAGAQPFRASTKPGAAPGGARPDLKTCDEADLIALIESGQSYYNAGSELLYRWAMQGVGEADAQRNLEAVFDAVPPAAQDSKWRKCRSRIPVYLARAYERAAKALAKARSSGAGRPLNIASPTPWPQPVDGEELLEEVAGALRTYVVLPEHALHAVSLWIIYTYMFTAAMITPRLLLKSAEKRSGKTTLLVVIERLASRALPTASISSSATFRTIDLASPTLLVDEADTFLSENEELRGVINAGFMRGGQTIRVVGDDHQPRAFNCFAPFAIATIRRLPDTIEDRAIAIAMRRKTKTESATRLRLDRLNQLAPLASKLQRWALDNMSALETADPDMPDALNDRAQDCWRPLLGIADIVGGAWPRRARSAATVLSADNEDIETTGTMLLADVRDLFAARAANELFSWEIVEVLRKMEERPWPEWGRRRAPITVVQLARLLAHFKIRPQTIRRGSDVAKGYAPEQFDDAFARYLS